MRIQSFAQRSYAEFSEELFRVRPRRLWFLPAGFPQCSQAPTRQQPVALPCGRESGPATPAEEPNFRAMLPAVLRGVPRDDARQTQARRAGRTNRGARRPAALLARFR